MRRLASSSFERKLLSPLDGRGVGVADPQRGPQAAAPQLLGDPPVGADRVAGGAAIAGDAAAGEDEALVPEALQQRAQVGGGVRGEVAGEKPAGAPREAGEGGQRLALPALEAAQQDDAAARLRPRPGRGGQVGRRKVAGQLEHDEGRSRRARGERPGGRQAGRIGHGQEDALGRRALELGVAQAPVRRGEILRSGADDDPGRVLRAGGAARGQLQAGRFPPGIAEGIDRIGRFRRGGARGAGAPQAHRLLARARGRPGSRRRCPR